MSDIKQAETETITETKGEKFVRIAENRMNKMLKAISGLENLSNRNTYAYTQEQVDAMFTTLEDALSSVKKSFEPKKVQETKSFSFGAMAPAADTQPVVEAEDDDDEIEDDE